MSFRFRHIVFWRSFVREKFSGATLEKGKLDGVVVATAIGIVEEGWEERSLSMILLQRRAIARPSGHNSDRLGNEPYRNQLRQAAISIGRSLTSKCFLSELIRGCPIGVGGNQRLTGQRFSGRRNLLLIR